MTDIQREAHKRVRHIEDIEDVVLQNNIEHVVSIDFWQYKVEVRTNPSTSMTINLPSSLYTNLY